MICTTKTNDISNDKLIDLHINNLNNIQKIISRLSSIGYTLLTIAITICSITIPLIFTLKISITIKAIISISSFINLFCLFVSHLINLKNERIWKHIYNNIIAIDILSIKSMNKCKEILFIDFNKEKVKRKKEINIFNSLKSWLTISWVPILIFNLISIGLIYIK